MNYILPTAEIAHRQPTSAHDRPSSCVRVRLQCDQNVRRLRRLSDASAPASSAFFFRSPTRVNVHLSAAIHVSFVSMPPPDSVLDCLLLHYEYNNIFRVDAGVQIVCPKRPTSRTISGCCPIVQHLKLSVIPVGKHPPRKTRGHDLSKDLRVFTSRSSCESFCESLAS